jgi:hypothetical protein
MIISDYMVVVLRQETSNKKKKLSGCPSPLLGKKKIGKIRKLSWQSHMALQLNFRWKCAPSKYVH